MRQNYCYFLDMKKKKRFGIDTTNPESLQSRSSSRVIEVKPTSTINLKANLKSTSRINVPFGTSVKVAEPRSIAAYRQTSSRGEYSSTQRNSAKVIKDLSREAERALSRHEAIKNYKLAKSEGAERHNYVNYSRYQQAAVSNSKYPSTIKRQDTPNAPNC